MVKQHQAGHDLVSQLANPASLSIVHTQDIAGCCHPAQCWLNCACWCPVLKRRTMNWIGENAILRNTPAFCPWNPARCSVCITKDFSSLLLLDREPFLPYFQCGRCTPCTPIGYATEEDLSFCMFCIDLNCCRRVFCEPCCGQCLWTVPCENGSFCFKLNTRCLCCFMIPIDCCMADSNTYRAFLMEQVAITQNKTLTENQQRVINETCPQSQRIVR